MIVPPPLFYLAALAIGIGLNELVPVALPPGRWRFVIGLVLAVIAAAVVVSVLVSFSRAGTAFDLRKKPTALVAHGPFRFSRHPSYLSLTFTYIAAGLMLGNGWVLLLTVPALLVTDRWIVPKEEARLEAVFGERYRHYKSAVHRWL